MDKYFIVPIESLRRNSKILPTGKPSPLGDMVPLHPPRVTSAGKVVRKIQISKILSYKSGVSGLVKALASVSGGARFGKGHAPVGEP